MARSIEKKKISQRKSDLKIRYGITLEQYNAILEKQGGGCAICGIGGGVYSLAVDHNHETGEVRGVLCHRCNTALGSLKDNVELLGRAIKYLESYGKR